MRKRLHDGQIGIWFLELVDPDAPQCRSKVVQGSGTVTVQRDGTVSIDGNDGPWTDEHGRRFFCRLNMRVYESVCEVIDQDPCLIGLVAG